MNKSITVAGIAVLGVLIWWASRPGDDARAPADRANEAAAATEAATPALLQGEVAAPAPAAVEPARDPTWFRLPDGTYAAALNGVRGAPFMDWPGYIPYSPIVGRETDPHGIEWYVHADGSKSTTQMIWRSDLGREDAQTIVANPAPAVPRDIDLPEPGGGPDK